MFLSQSFHICETCLPFSSKGTRKSQTTKAASTPVKYCSDRCRHNKPSQAPGSTDRRIQDTFVALLNGNDPPPDGSQDTLASPEPPPPKPAKPTSKKVKGETRIIVSCAEVEVLVFGARHDPEKAFGRKKNRARRGLLDPKEWKSVDMEDSDNEPESESSDLFTTRRSLHPFRTKSSSTDTQNHTPDDAQEPSSSDDSDSDTGPADMISLRVRPPQTQSEVNGSVGGEKGWAEKIDETPEMLQKRREGQRRANERELVRCAARRLCAFGVVVVDADASVEGGHAREKGAKGKGKGKERGKGGVTGDGDVGGGGGGGGTESRKKCEAVMSDRVVEASYAKGEWGIRWRE